MCTVASLTRDAGTSSANEEHLAPVPDPKHHSEENVDLSSQVETLSHEESDKTQDKTLLEEVNTMGQGHDDIQELHDLLERCMKYDADSTQQPVCKALGEAETEGQTVLRRPEDLAEVFGSQSELNFYKFCQESRLSNFMANRLLRMVTDVSDM